MDASADRLVDEYLDRLEFELADLPRARRRELVDEIAEHIAEARAGGAESEAEVRTLLDRLGDPAEIAAEARGREAGPTAPPAKSGGTLEVFALILLLVGGIIVPLLGWVAGVVLLWMSGVWTVRDKLIGTFLIPEGSRPRCSSSSSGREAAGAASSTKAPEPPGCRSRPRARMMSRRPWSGAPPP